MKNTSITKSRLLGEFTLPSGHEAFGELNISGRDTLLRLRCKGFIPPLGNSQAIHGRLHDLRKVSCLQCVVNSSESSSAVDAEEYHHANIFPHFVTVGSEFLHPDQSSIKAVHFTVDDITSIFNDFQAFGHVIDSKSLIETVVRANKREAAIPVGDLPFIAYFTGKLEVVSVDTAIGRISVNHWPRFNSGGSNGVFIKNQMMLTVEPISPVTFNECIDRTMTLVKFTSLLAGRKQGIKSIRLSLATESDELIAPLELSWSYSPQGYEGEETSIHKPHSADVPLDALRRPEEFASVLRDWIARESTWGTARAQYNGCLRKGDFYDVDRLIAAANMFDILPDEAVPLAASISQELATAQKECLSIFRALPQGVERDNVIGALSRMAKPSLTKKVLHRASIVERSLGHLFPDLKLVVRTAIKCRNYFVHGASDDFDFKKIEPLSAFLTDTLEFIFTSSDLIEAGWDAQAWSNGGYGWGHSFARFRGAYDLSLIELQSALGKSA